MVTSDESEAQSWVMSVEVGAASRERMRHTHASVGHNVDFMVDSGAARSVCGLPDSPSDPCKPSSDIRCGSASGSTWNHYGKTTVNLPAPGYCLNVNFDVIDVVRPGPKRLGLVRQMMPSLVFATQIADSGGTDWDQSRSRGNSQRVQIMQELISVTRLVQVTTDRSERSASTRTVTRGQTTTSILDGFLTATSRSSR